MKDDWQNRDLEFGNENESLDMAREEEDDFEKSQEEKSFHRPPSNNFPRRDFRMKPGGQGSIEPNGISNRIPLKLMI